MAIDQSVIEEVGSLTDIVEVIGAYVPLRKAGTNFKAPCPFHKEKTPSFMVSPQKQIYHCFGCGEGGNAFSFIMKIEGMSFPEAIKHLAEKCGVKVPEFRSGSDASHGKRDRLAKLAKAAVTYYEKMLWDLETGRQAREYLTKRQIPNEIAKTFHLGWAGPGWRGLIEYATQAGFQMDEMAQLGLIATSREKRFDMFRQRLMFPIFDVQGKPVGFGGRILGQGEPKYLNSPETAIFKKRRELFNLHQSKSAIIESKTAFVVEGYMDVISLWQYGIENVVATLGTALTNEHVRLLKRYANKVIMVYDGDSAGLRAAERGLEVFAEEECPVQVLELPKGMDPDDLVRKEGKDAFLKYADQALDMFEFKFRLTAQNWDGKETAGLTRVTKTMLDFITRLKSPVLVDRYLKQLAEKLGIREDALRMEAVQKHVQKNKVRSYEPDNVTSDDNSRVERYPEETLFLTVVLQHPELIEQALTRMTADQFLNKLYERIWQRLEVQSQTTEQFSVDAFVRTFHQQEELKCLSELLSREITGDASRIFNDCLRRIQRREIKSEMDRLRELIRQAEKIGDDKQLREGLNALQALAQQHGS